MFERYLIEYCSPTLASIKTANLFHIPYTSKQDLYESIRLWNIELRKKGITITILREESEKALVYVYRKKSLLCDLSKPGVREFLRNYGYVDDNHIHAINRLRQRFLLGSDFPHEIGLFLGYPLADVIGFIENAGQNTKCSGCWKVYCNECDAIKLFARYKKCKEIYARLWSEGLKSVCQLTVAKN